MSAASRNPLVVRDHRSSFGPGTGRITRRASGHAPGVREVEGTVMIEQPRSPAATSQKWGERPRATHGQTTGRPGQERENGNPSGYGGSSAVLALAGPHLLRKGLKTDAEFQTPPGCTTPYGTAGTSQGSAEADIAALWAPRMETGLCGLVAIAASTITCAARAVSAT
jgi:hypothetical protein